MENNWILYKHTCPDSKVYIGITSNLQKRWSSYGRQYAHCINFFTAICRYGWDNIEHEILKEGLTREEAGELEKLYIKELRACEPKYGYNMTMGGFGCKKGVWRKINQYDINGNYIASFNSMADASRKLNIDRHSINKVVKKYSGRTTAGGYIFRYEGDSLDLHLLEVENVNCKKVYQLNDFKEIVCKYESIKDAASSIGVNHSSISKACKYFYRIRDSYWCFEDDFSEFCKKRPTSSTPVVQIDMNGAFLMRYKSIEEAHRITGISKTSISSCVQKRHKTAGGYIWKKYGDESELILDSYDNMCKKAVCQYTKDGKFVKSYESMTKASKATGATVTGIGFVCKNDGTQKTAGGYMWRFKDDTSEVLPLQTVVHGRRVLQLDKNGTVLGDYPSIQIAAKESGVGYNSIQAVCAGRQITGGGFRWKYA